MTNSADAKTPAADVTILNVALGLELEAIAAYKAGAGSKLLSGAALDMAGSFLKDHERHRDLLVAWIHRLGGTPVQAKSAYDFGTITSAADIVNLAHRLEQGAADAYLANAGNLTNAGVLDDAAGVLVDEVRHATALKMALSLPVTQRPAY